MAAARALGHSRPVIRRKDQQQQHGRGGVQHGVRKVEAPAFSRYRLHSSINESQVSGCQVDIWLAVNAQRTPAERQTMTNRRVGIDVLVVVEIDEAEAGGLAEHQPQPPAATGRRRRAWRHGRRAKGLRIRHWGLARWSPPGQQFVRCVNWWACQGSPSAAFLGSGRHRQFGSGTEAAAYSSPGILQPRNPEILKSLLKYRNIVRSPTDAAPSARRRCPSSWSR